MTTIGSAGIPTRHAPVVEAVHPLHPTKRIRNASDTEEFKRRPSFAKICRYIDACCNAVQGVARTDEVVQSLTASPVAAPLCTFFLEHLFVQIRTAVREIPLQDMAKQRFGNKAYRDFHARLVREAPMLAVQLHKAIQQTRSYVMAQPAAGAPTKTTTEEEANSAAAAVLPPPPTVAEDAQLAELAAYICDSFGNSQRLDYGTGHELHFFLLLMIALDQSNVTVTTDESAQQTLLRSAVLVIFWEYIAIMRELQAHYSLEPAGSHGVWGLDDYHHLTFVFGASQLIGHDDEARYDANPAQFGGPLLLPKHITDAAIVHREESRFLYFRSVAWILSNKRGPFHEHSNMLYNISGVDRWKKITAGMLKMYHAEVLGKFNVVQHLLFGQLFPY